MDYLHMRGEVSSVVGAVHAVELYRSYRIRRRLLAFGIMVATVLAVQMATLPSILSGWGAIACLCFTAVLILFGAKHFDSHELDRGRGLYRLGGDKHGGAAIAWLFTDARLLADALRFPGGSNWSVHRKMFLESVEQFPVGIGGAIRTKVDELVRCYNDPTCRSETLANALEEYQEAIDRVMDVFYDVNVRGVLELYAVMRTTEARIPVGATSTDRHEQFAIFESEVRRRRRFAEGADDRLMLV